jgi:PPM family protein phosphatase
MYTFDYAAQTDVGLVRETNQDEARVVPGLHLALVADGMGGHAHGDVASRTATSAFEENLTRVGGPGANTDETAERVRTSFWYANQRIAEHPTTRASATGMGTTLVAAVFSHGRVVIGNVGDSRCYRLRSGFLEVMTQDHSYLAHLLRSGEISKQDEVDHSARWAHMLTRCLNGEDGVEADLRIGRCEPGDVYLLCTDGLWGTLSNKGIASILGSAEDADAACEKLVEAALGCGGHDNIGVAVVRLVPDHLRLDDPRFTDRASSPSSFPGPSLRPARTEETPDRK